MATVCGGFPWSRAYSAIFLCTSDHPVTPGDWFAHGDWFDHGYWFQHPQAHVTIEAGLHFLLWDGVVGSRCGIGVDHEALMFAGIGIERAGLVALEKHSVRPHQLGGLDVVSPPRLEVCPVLCGARWRNIGPFHFVHPGSLSRSLCLVGCGMEYLR